MPTCGLVGINSDYFCGGAINADMRATETALQELASRLSVSVDEAARGIVRIANDNMVNALKLVSLNRGHDTRDFTLLAFGAGGAMHAVALAQELQICLLYTSPSPRDQRGSRMPSSA